MSTKHTPGPWHSSKCSCGHPRCKDYWIDSGSFCQGSGFSEADAQLIAAAPDLLEALLKMLGQFNENMVGIVHDELQAVVTARQAVSKALGEQQ